MLVKIRIILSPLCATFCAIPLLYLIKKYFGGPLCSCATILKNKVVVITGGNSGIGLEVVRDFASRGACVIFTVRNLGEGESIKRQISEQTGNTDIACLFLDLNSFSSIRQFAETLKIRIDILINNAGTFYHPPSKTQDGFSVTLQTNYLGQFLLTELLKPKLNPGARIVFLSSESHKLCKSLDLSTLSHFDLQASGISERFLSYGTSKLCLLLYSKYLANQLKDNNTNIYNVHPGSVETAIYRHFPLLQNPFLRAIQKPIRYVFIKTPFQGAQTVIHCAVSPKLSSETGLYYVDLKPSKASKLASDLNLACKLYHMSLIWTHTARQGSN